MSYSQRNSRQPGDLRDQRGGALQVFLLILGILVLLGILAVLAGLWAVRQYVQVEVERAGPTRSVSIRTPIGDLEVRKAEDVAAQLKLPIYPEATPDEESASVRLRGRLWEEEGGLDIIAAQFRTPDDFDAVDAWYRQQLGPDYKREAGRIIVGDRRGDRDGGLLIRVEPGGNDVLYTQHRAGGLRGVGLRRQVGQVKIHLFEVAEASRQ